MGIKDLSDEVFEEQEHTDTQEGESGSDKAVNSDEERRVVNGAFDANSTGEDMFDMFGVAVENIFGCYANERNKCCSQQNYFLTTGSLYIYTHLAPCNDVNN